MLHLNLSYVKQPVTQHSQGNIGCTVWISQHYVSLLLIFSAHLPDVLHVKLKAHALGTSP